jgi:hypothetical protein
MVIQIDKCNANYLPHVFTAFLFFGRETDFSIRRGSRLIHIPIPRTGSGVHPASYLVEIIMDTFVGHKLRSSVPRLQNTFNPPYSKS